MRRRILIANCEFIKYMSKKVLTLGCAALLLATACKNKNDMENPFFNTLGGDSTA